MGKFTIDDFTNFAIDGKYLAYPLLLILIITVFVLLLWIVHGMLALISTINGKSIKEKFKSIEEEICLGENCKEIIKALFDYVFMTILSILGFLSFIPSYFTAMANLANVAILTKKEKSKEEKKNNESHEEEENKNE